MLQLHGNFRFTLWLLFFKFDKVTDLAYGSNFVFLALLTFFLDGSYFVRQILITFMVVLWGLRLSIFLFVRILIIGKDKRFDDIRSSSLKFLVWFFLQYVTVWSISVPFILLNSTSPENPPLAWNDFIGWILFIIGFLCETIADHQKFVYRSKTENENHWCDVGLWKFSRHPNYFGEILVWWGIFISCASVLSDIEWLAIGSPLLITATLLFLSGIPTTEKSTDKRFWNHENYQHYKKKTPVLFPFPSISCCPSALKKVLCCEWSIYSYPPEMGLPILD